MTCTQTIRWGRVGAGEGGEQQEEEQEELIEESKWFEGGTAVSF